MVSEQLSLKNLGKNPLAWFCALVFVLAFSPYFLPIMSPDGLYNYGDIWADMPLIALTVLITLVRRPADEAPRDKYFWQAIGIGFGVWFLGRVAWGVWYELGLIIDLVADLLFQFFYVGMLIALELNPGSREPSRFEKKVGAFSLTGGIVLLLTGYVYFALIPALVSPETYESWKPAVIGACAFDFYIAVRLIVRYRRCRDEAWRIKYAWLMAGFVLWFITDTIDVVWLYYPMEFLNPGGILDVFWYAPYGLVAVGALLGRQSTKSVPHAEPLAEPWVAAGPLGGIHLVAYAFSLLFIHTTLEWLGALDPELGKVRAILLSVESVIMFGLVVVLYRMIIKENRRLRGQYQKVANDLKEANADLDARVKKRTGQLEETNKLLAEDIKERVRIEGLLRSAEERNQALIKAVPDTLAMVNKNGQIIDVSLGREGQDLLGLQDNLGRTLVEMVPENCRRLITDSLALAGTLKYLPPVPARLEGPHGGTHIEFRFSACGHGDTLVLIQDVSDRRKAELSLQQSQKLESLGVLAGGIAHDFNNVLASILGNAQLAKETLFPGQDIPRPLKTIENSALRAAKLTGNLLAYAGEAHIELVPCNLSSLVKEINDLLSTAIPKNVQLHIPDLTSEFWIEGNDTQVSQVIMNLVRNAAESTSGPIRRIDVDVNSRELDGQVLSHQVLGENPRPGPYVCLTVKDNGSGISESDQERIFDPFFTSKGAGRGLGLAAVLGIVAHHNGLMTLESYEGKGTEFRVYFPACAHPETRVEKETVETGQDHQGLVLVVDDEDDVRAFVSAYLKRHGLDVLEAEDGASALETAMKHRGQLKAIFMDYSMPVMDGAEAHHALRKMNIRVPVIMMSGFGEGEILSTLTDEANTLFLHKPFDLKSLLAALNAAEGLDALEGQA